MKFTTRRNATLILGLALLLTLAAFSSAIEPASALQLFQSPEGTPGVGLKGEYFANTTLDGSPVLTRIDPQVDFTWGEGSPAFDVPADQFSVRWTGQVEAPFSEDYTFHTLSDDGIRLSLNGQVIIENWSEHGPTWDDNALISLTAGQRYTLTLEYYENGGGADAHLEWSSPSTPRQVIPSDRLYPDVGIWTVKAAPETVMADGVATAAVTISLTNLAGDPLPDLPAYLQVSGRRNWINGQLTGEAEWVEIGSSGPNGIVTATLASTVAETKAVHARVQGVIVGGTATFIAAEPVGLQILLPGEAATPGVAPGKTGAPRNQVAGWPFEVTVRAIDAYWNTATAVTDTVVLTSTDPQADLPAQVTLTNGQAVAPVTFNATGIHTVSAIDLVQPGMATSSAVVTLVPGEVTLYEHPEYGGQAESFAENDPDLSDNLIGRNAASSIRMRGPARALLFGRPDYQGWVLSVITDVPNLDTLWFNDAASSLRLLPYPTGPVSVTDEFAEATLDPAWNWNIRDSAETYSLAEQPGEFRLTVPEGDPGGLEYAPVLQRFDVGRGDWAIETRVSLVSFDSAAPYRAGLELGLRHPQRVFFGLRESGQLGVDRFGRAAANTAYANSSVYLRVEKHGRAFTFSYRPTSDDEWQTLATWPIAEPVEFVGLFGWAVSDIAPLTAGFDVFHLESDDTPVIPPEPTPDAHDDFTTALDNAWSWFAPQAGARYSLTESPGQFQMVIPSGDVNYDSWSDGDNAPQLRRQDLANDWAIQTLVTLAGENPYDTCCFHTGLGVGFGSYGKFVLGPMQSRQLRVERIGEYSAEISYPYPSVELRIEKTGSWYVFKYRAASSDPWAILDERYTVEPVTWVGLITRAWDNRAAPVMADYSYFDLTRSGPVPDGVLLYENPGYWGRGEFFAADDPDLNDNTIGSHTATSVLVRGNVRALLFLDPNYGGMLTSIVSDAPNLETPRFNDATASIKVLPYPTGPVSVTDEFTETLDPAWNWNLWQDKSANYSLTEQPGQLRLTIQAGAHGYWEDMPFLQRYDMGRGDFTMETQVSLGVYSPTAPYQAGLALGLSGYQRILFGLRENGRLWIERLGRNELETPYAGTSVYLRIEKRGQALDFAYRATPGDEWQTLATWDISA